MTTTDQLKPSNAVDQGSADLRPALLRLSTPANQRFVSVAPNRRRSLSRRSAFLRNLHAQLVGIVQPTNGRRGASRDRKSLPVTWVAAVQQMRLGAISTARKLPVLFSRLGPWIAVGLLPGRSRENLPSNPFKTLIMTASPCSTSQRAKDSPMLVSSFPLDLFIRSAAKLAHRLRWVQCHMRSIAGHKQVRALRWVAHSNPL
jgi:hypothetical protein